MPNELLQEQIELMKVANTYQNSILESQLKNIEIQVEWLKLVIEEQRRQTSDLKNISLAATIFILAAIVSVIFAILGACLWLYSSVKMALP